MSLPSAPCTCTDNRKRIAAKRAKEEEERRARLDLGKPTRRRFLPVDISSANRDSNPAVLRLPRGRNLATHGQLEVHLTAVTLTSDEAYCISDATVLRLESRRSIYATLPASPRPMDVNFRLCPRHLFRRCAKPANVPDGNISCAL